MRTIAAGNGLARTLKKIPTLAALLFFLAATAGAQLRLNGYFSADYFQTLGKKTGNGGSFENPAAGLIISGEWASQFSYALELRTGAEWKPEIEQAWAAWSGSESMRARIGLFLVPFGRLNEANRPFQTMLAAFPYPYGESSPSSWREIGVQVDGRIGVFRYIAYLGNGLAEAATLSGGQQFRDNNRNKGYGLRLSLTLSQELEVAGSYYRGKQDAANLRNLTLLGADLAWTTQNVRCTAEYTRTDVVNPSPFASGRAEGWYVLLGLNFGQLTPLIAYQTSKTTDPFHGLGWMSADAAGAGILADHNRLALGATYAVYANILLKLEYDIQKDTLLNRKDNVLRVQAAVHF
jgi:hypothetical protein